MTCFDRGSNERDDFIACGGELKSCCVTGESCATNGLCVTNDTTALTPYFIHGCTVQDWDAASCPQDCNNSSGAGVTPCGEDKYCCYGLTGCNCSDTSQLFTLNPVRLVANDTDDPLAFTTSTTTSTTSLDTHIASTTSSAESTHSSTHSSTPGGSSSLAIGLGVGLSVGIVFTAMIVGLVWFFKIRRTSKPSKMPVYQKSYEVYTPAKSATRTVELESHETPSELA